MDFVPTAAMAALVMTVVNFARYARGKDWSAVLTQALSWAGGVAAMAIYSRSDFASGVMVGDVSLAGLSGWSVVAVGLTVGAAPSVLVEGLKAIDNTRSTSKPALLRRKPTDEGKGLC